MAWEGDWREGVKQKTRPPFITLSHHISSFLLECTLPLALRRRENPPCIMHKGIMNDSSGTILEERRPSLDLGNVLVVM